MGSLWKFLGLFHEIGANVIAVLLGTILSFMMAVTTLSLPSMIMLRKEVKQKLLGVFVTICIVAIIIIGYVFNISQYLLI